MRGFYLADCPDTAWAEWMRATAEDGVPPARRLPRDVWTLEVDAERVIDLSTTGALEAVGLPPIHPTQAQWPAYQARGEAYWRDGTAGVLAPSAAHLGHRVLCIFRSEPAEPAVPGVVEIPPPETYATIPVIPVGLRT